MRAIETSGLTVVYRRGLFATARRALEALDLVVEAGEIFGYLGPNGAGKTTTIKSLLGLIEPAAGSARIFGADIREVRCRAGVGFLPEAPYFYEYLTGCEFLAFMAALSGVAKVERKRRIPEVLEQVGLAAAGDMRLREYSRGMKQRIGLAQAILHRPRLAVLDEPMGGLDPVGRAEVRELIRRMRADGATIFLSSHILADVEALCDRVGIIHRGRLRASGALSAVLSPRILRYRVQVMGLNEGAVGPLGAFELHRDGELLSFSLSAACDTGGLLSLIAERGGRLLSLLPEREDLEAAFMRQIREEDAGAGDA